MGESLADRFVLDGYLCDWHRTAAAAEAALLTRVPDDAADAGR